MAPVLIVAGAGTAGISSATADIFASNGFNVALLSRTQEKLDKVVAGKPFKTRNWFRFVHD